MKNPQAQPLARILPFRRPEGAEARPQARPSRVEITFAPGWPAVVRPVERKDSNGRRRIEIHFAPGWPVVALSEDDDVTAVS